MNVDICEDKAVETTPHPGHEIMRRREEAMLSLDYGGDVKNAVSENDSITPKQPGGLDPKVTTERYALKRIEAINVTVVDDDLAKVSLAMNNNCERRSEKILPLKIPNLQSKKSWDQNSAGCNENVASDRPVEIPKESEIIKGKGYLHFFFSFASFK